MPASPPPDVTASAIFLRAQRVWSARAVPPFESFRLPCEQTFLSDSCPAGSIVQFVVRTADGRSFTQFVNPDGSLGRILARGTPMVGPAGAPFGFYRRTPVPGALRVVAAQPAVANDPIATIASVTAVDRAYDIVLASTVTVDGRSCFDLRLRPLRDPDVYPLRGLVVDRASAQIVALTYAQPFNGTTATVHYTFAPAGAQMVWTIVHIDAEATFHDFLHARTERVSEDLRDIAFPASEPASDFKP